MIQTEINRMDEFKRTINDQELKIKSEKKNAIFNDLKPKINLRIRI